MFSADEPVTKEKCVHLLKELGYITTSDSSPSQQPKPPVIPMEIPTPKISIPVSPSFQQVLQEQVQQKKQDQQKNQNKKIYDRATFQKMTIKQLKQLPFSKGLSGKKKKDMIQQLLRRVSSSSSPSLPPSSPVPSLMTKTPVSTYTKQSLNIMTVKDLKKLPLAKGLSKYKKEQLIQQLVKRSTKTISPPSLSPPLLTPNPPLPSTGVPHAMEQKQLRVMTVKDLKKLPLAKGLSKYKKDDLIRQLVRRSKLSFSSLSS